MKQVTREMIGAGHGVTMKRGVVLSHDILAEIYLAMDALANQEKTSGSPMTGPCTCHPDDNPPVPCAQQYAFSECKKKAAPPWHEWDGQRYVFVGPSGSKA